MVIHLLLLTEVQRPVLRDSANAFHNNSYETDKYVFLTTSRNLHHCTGHFQLAEFDADYLMHHDDTTASELPTRSPDGSAEEQLNAIECSKFRRVYPPIGSTRALVVLPHGHAWPKILFRV